MAAQARACGQLACFIRAPRSHPPHELPQTIEPRVLAKYCLPIFYGRLRGAAPQQASIICTDFVRWELAPMQDAMQNTTQNTKRKLSSFWGWLILGTIAWLTWAAWPTSVWLLLCLFMAWMLNAFAAKLHRPFYDRKRI